MQIARLLFRTLLLVVALSPAIARADDPSPITPSPAIAQASDPSPNTARSVIASADDPSPITPGTLEFFPSLAFNRSTFNTPGGAASGSVTHLNFAAGIGHCFSEDFELTGTLLAQHKAVGGEGRNGFGGSAGATFNFAPQGNVIPFASGAVGLISYSTNGESDRAWMFPMLRAGFRTMMFGTRSVNVSLGYHHEINPESTFEESSNVFDVGVGFSIFRPRSN